MSFSAAVASIKTAIEGSNTPSLVETPTPLRVSLEDALWSSFDRSYYLGLEADGRPDEHGIQPAGQERSECRLVVELGAELQNDRNDDQAELQVIAQKVGEALLMLQTSDIVFLRTDERPNILQIDRKIIWRQVWTLTYRIT
jgi:hypothetical protein